MQPALFSSLPTESAAAAEILAKNWAATALGPINGWPVALRIYLATMIACPTPMFLAWGPELISFYNDAYRPILGHRADGAMGKPFQELWASIWTDIAPLVNKALAGENVKVTDLPLDLSRQGVPEESFWSFSYSPAFDDAGHTNGMLCVTGETTDRVLAERSRDSSDERLQLALSAGNSIGTWDWDVITDIVRADTRFAALYGVDPAKASLGAPIAEFFAGIHPADLPRVQNEIRAAMDGGIEFKSEYRLLQTDGSVKWVAAQGHCIVNEAGVCVRFPGVSFDITEQKLAALELLESKNERDFVIALTGRQLALSDPLTIIKMTTEALASRLNADRVGFYRVLSDAKLQHVGCTQSAVLPALMGEQATDAFGKLAATERRKGRTLIFSDTRHGHGGGLTAYAAQGVLAGICVPLLDNGRWVHGIYVHHASVRPWSNSEISLVKEIGQLITISVERAEAVARLNDRVHRLDAELVEATSDIILQSQRRSEAEEQLRQLQKMEAVGQLTGGIAHDFNNMLAIVIGGLNFAQRKLQRGDINVNRHLDHAMEGATRAANLTQRLLAFSRQQPLAPESIDANKLIGGLAELLTRTIGEPISMETVLGAGLWRAKIDPNQLENAIINLAVNARDAMPDGGKLTIETSNAAIDESYAHEAQIAAGQYVHISVSDTGTGMPPDVLSKAFDPFFTTKGVGKGTGLGLSQVFGFVRQSGGHVKIYSEVGFGTTIKLYLPRFWGDAVRTAEPRTPKHVRAGSPQEIILVVEDEERVRNYSVEALREFGYTVLHAACPSEALAIIERGQDLTLLFTDIVMPGMTGRQLADRAVALRPNLKVLYTTGYTRNAVVHNGVLDPGTNFIAKPFGLDQLATKVRAVLDN